MGTRSTWESLRQAVVGASLLFAATTAAAELDLTAREILATGDFVEGFGRVGSGGIAVHGIDGAGRLLMSGHASTGLDLLFWADTGGLTPLWTGRTPDDDRLLLGRAVANARGDVIVAAHSTSIYNEEDLVALYDVGAGAPRRLVRIGDAPRGGGLPLCALGDFVVNESGVVALTATTTRPDGTCGTTVGLYVVEADGLRRVEATLPSPSSRSVRLAGLAADGTLLAVDLDGTTAIVAIRNGTSRVIVDGDTVGPAGEPLDDLQGWAANARGDVAFITRNHGAPVLYRTADGVILRVAGYDDELSGGVRLLSVYGDGLALNDDGRVAARADWDVGGTVAYGTIIFPDGAAPSLMAGSSPQGLNADGIAALLAWRPRPLAGVRWDGDRHERLVAAGDGAPGGGVFAVGGLGDSFCLAADGRAVSTVFGTDINTGLLCSDASHSTTLAAIGDAAPEGGRFIGFSPCAIAADGSVLFGAAREIDASRSDYNIYRATPAGLERLIGPGTPTANGGQVEELYGVPAFNDRGTLLVAGRTSADHYTVVLRRRLGGAVEVVRFELADGTSASMGPEYGLAADDSVLAVGTVPPGEEALLRSDGTHATVLGLASDPALPGAPFYTLSGLRVRGERAIVLALPASSSSETRWLQYTPSGGLHALPMPDTPGSRAYVGEFSPLRTLFGASSGEYFAADDGGDMQRISATTSTDERRPEAINDRGNILFWVRRTAAAPFRHVLERSGPAPEGSPCFVPPTAVLTQVPPPTPTPDPFACTGDGSQCAHLRVGSATGDPGQRVTVVFTLDSGPLDVAGIQCDVQFNAVASVAASAERPACRTNPAIDKDGSLFAFQPSGCELAGECTAARGLVLALDNVDPIPTGSVLFECDLDIDANAAPGRYPLAATRLGASNPRGKPVPLGLVPGVIEVRAAEPTPGGAFAVAGDQGGCQVGGGAAGGSWLLGLAALLLLRRAR